MAFCSEGTRSAIALLGLAANAAAHIVFFRGIRALGMLRALLVGFFSGVGAVVMLNILLHEDFGMAAANLITYVLWGYAYFHFVNLGETGRRIRILREFEEAPQGLSTAELLNRYNAQEVIERRMERLLSSAQVVSKNGAYRIANPLLLWSARTIVFLKMLLLGCAHEIPRRPEKL